MFKLPHKVTDSNLDGFPLVIYKQKHELMHKCSRVLFDEINMLLALLIVSP